jgi:hypothetical protein
LIAATVCAVRCGSGLAPTSRRTIWAAGSLARTESAKRAARPPETEASPLALLLTIRMFMVFPLLGSVLLEEI